MSNMDRFKSMPVSTDCELSKMLDTFCDILVDGIRHGFFNAKVTVSTPRADRREVVISAGKSHKYTIKLDDLPH